MVVLEPLTVSSTRFVTYLLSDHHDGSQESSEALKGEQSLVDLGAEEDRAVIASIQRSLAANPREFFEFGLFEGAIGHFHRELAAALVDGTTDAMGDSAEGDVRGTRQRFVDAAAELLSKGGYAAASVQSHRRAGRRLRRRALPPLPVEGRALRRGVPRRGEARPRRTPQRARGGRRHRSPRGGHRGARPPRAARPAPRLGAAARARGYACRRRAPHVPPHLHRNVAKLLRQAIAAGEIPAQEVELSAAAIVGALAEALVGPLSPISDGKPSEDQIVDHVVRFCRRAVGAASPTRSAQTTRSRKARAAR